MFASMALSGLITIVSLLVVENVVSDFTFMKVFAYALGNMIGTGFIFSLKKIFYRFKVEKNR